MSSTARLPRVTASPTPPMRTLMSRVESLVWLASSLTSAATTPKPRPASPARAASMAALSASRLVCRAISEMTPTMLFTAAAAAVTSAITCWARMTSCTARSDTALLWWDWLPISRIDAASSSVAAAICSLPCRASWAAVTPASDMAEQVRVEATTPSLVRASSSLLANSSPVRSPTSTLSERESAAMLPFALSMTRSWASRLWSAAEMASATGRKEPVIPRPMYWRW